MARRLVVSDGERAQECQPLAFKVAVGGVVKQITKACCVENGIVRQFWPPAPGTGDERIIWNSNAITVAHSAIDPLDALASITFNRASGYFSYSNYPSGDTIALYLNPALDGTAGDDDKYIIKVDQVSGDTITGTLATWIDLNSASLMTWSLPKTVVGSSTALANITVAQDNGAGSPVGGTSVVKAVTFYAEVVSTSHITWTTVQEDLVEITEAQDADCILTFNPDGSAVGDADTSGSFNENWHTDTPTVTDASLYSVKATLISGTAPTGSALATALSLDLVREWTLLAESGEDLSCALDIEVDTIPTSNPVVKRITMNSEYIADPVLDPTWTTDAWSCSDVGYEQGAALEVTVDLIFEIVGSAGLFMTSFKMGTLQFAGEFWFPWPPAPTPTELNDYEVMITNVTGASHVDGPTWDVWHRMTSERDFELVYITHPTNQFVYTFDALVRKVGGVAITKEVTVTVAASEGIAP